MNELVEPQMLTKASPSELTLQESIDLIMQRYSANTKRAYARAMRDFQDWLSVQDIHLEQVKQVNILQYQISLKEQGKKPATINQNLSCLKKVFSVLLEFGYIQQNPCDSETLQSEKVSPLSNKNALRFSQLEKLLSANQSEKYDCRTSQLIRSRNGLLIRFLYFTAARRGEVAGLRWEHLCTDGDFHIAVLPETKSGVPQRLKIREDLYKKLMEWKDILMDFQIHSPWVFPSLSQRTIGQQMTGGGINRAIKKLGKAIGIDISAHYLRHTAITIAFDLGQPLEKVRGYARHVSADTTLRYYHDRDILRKNPTDILPAL